MAKNQEWLDSASDAQRNLLQDPSAAGIQELRNWASIAKQSREVQSEPSEESPDIAFVHLCWEEILGQLQMLRSEDAEEIYSEAFSSTPYGMYNEMVQLVRLRGPSSSYARDVAIKEMTDLNVRKARMRAEAQPVDEEASTVETGAPAEEDIGNVPNPDGFVPASERLPKGFTVATAHAEAVLLERILYGTDH